jgi:selenocysteine lyase/cysteine desulfurase
MNSGSLGPSPRCVLDQAMKAWHELEEDPVTQGFGPFIHKMDDVRRKAAEFLGCSTEEIAITQNTTDGMNTVAQGLELQPGQRVLTTDHEHPGGLVCWEYYARRRQVLIDKVQLPIPPGSAEEVVAKFREKLTPETRVISVSHVTFSTGLRLPVREIAAMARANGTLLVVDGAQAPGALEVNVKDLDCDAYATSGHKWMLGPKGTGLLYVRKETRKAIDPLTLQHGNQAYTASTGTRNIPSIIGLGAAIDFLTSLGKSRIEQHALSIRKRVYEGSQGLPRLQLVSPPDGELASALVTFKLPQDVAADRLTEVLRAKHRVVVKPVPAHLVNGIRVSCHVCNSEEDVAKLLDALRKEVG